MLILGIYLFAWGYYNGSYETGGIKLILFNNRWIQSALILLIVYNTQFDVNAFRKVIVIGAITIVIAGIVSLIQIFIDPTLFVPLDSADYLEYNKTRFIYGPSYAIRRESIYASLWSELDYSFIPMYILISTYYKIHGKHRRNVIVDVIGSIPVIASNTRSTMIGFLFGLLSQYKIRLRNIMVITLAPIMFVMIFFYILSLSGIDVDSYISERIMSRSGMSRINAFIAVSQHMPKNILVGTGGVNSSIDINWKLHKLGGSQIHNLYLAYFVYYGIVGLFLLVLVHYFLLRGFRASLKIHNNKGPIIGFSSYILIQLFNIPFGGILAHGLIFCFVFDKYYVEQANKIS